MGEAPGAAQLQADGGHARGHRKSIFECTQRKFSSLRRCERWWAATCEARWGAPDWNASRLQATARQSKTRSPKAEKGLNICARHRSLRRRRAEPRFEYVLKE